MNWKREDIWMQQEENKKQTIMNLPQLSVFSSLSLNLV